MQLQQKKIPLKRKETFKSMSRSPQPVPETERKFFNDSDEDLQRDKIILNSEADNEFLKICDDYQIDNAHINQLYEHGQEIDNMEPIPTEAPLITCSKVPIPKEPNVCLMGSFESIAESVQEKQCKPLPFNDSKRRAGCCSILTYWFANSLIESVNLNKGKLDLRMIETMNSNPKRDEKLLKKFTVKLNNLHECWKAKNPNLVPQDGYEDQKSDDAYDKAWYYFTKKACYSTFGCMFYQTVFLVIFAELCTLGSMFMIREFAEYLTLEEHDMNQASITIAIFAGLVILGVLIRNLYLYYGSVMAIEVRKLLIVALYDKLGRLTLRSLAET